MNIPTWISPGDVTSYESVQKKHKSASLVDVNFKKQTPKPCGLPSRELESDAFMGDIVSRTECFGCSYGSEMSSGYVAREDIVALKNMIRSSIAQTDPINLAINIAKRYEIIRKDVNSSLLPGQTPIPPWTASTVLDHLRNHNLDPDMQDWFRGCEVQEMIQVALHASVEVNPDTGEKTLNEKQCKLYMELVKTADFISKSDSSKKKYYSGGAHMDVKSASQGPIATSGKPLISYLRNIRKRV